MGETGKVPYSFVLRTVATFTPNAMNNSNITRNSIAAVLAALTLAGAIDWNWVGDVLSHASAPVWVQAIGTILAVSVAIWVPAQQRSHSRKDAEVERRVKARSIALAIYLPLLADHPHYILLKDLQKNINQGIFG